MTRQSLFRKFTRLVIPLVVLTALAVGLMFGYISHQAFLHTVRADYSVAAAQASRHISFFMQTASQQILATAGFVAAIRLDEWRTLMAITELRHQFPQFQYMALVDLEGREMVRSWFNQDLWNRQAWDTFQEAKKGRLACSRMVIQDSRPVIFLAAPVYYDGELTSIVWARLNVKPVWDVVIQLKRDLNFGANGHIFLVDQANTLIGGDEISMNFGQVFDLDIPRSPATASRLDLKTWQDDKRLDTHDPETLKSLLQDRLQRPDFWIGERLGVKSIYLRARIRDLGWQLVMIQPYSEAFHFLYQGIWTGSGLIALAIIVGVVLIWLTARRFLAPIARLRQGVARAARGDLKQAIEVETNDEVGELANHFNEMQAALQDYIDRLMATTADLNHAKCLAVLGTTASKVNHQVGNFLNNLVLALSIIKADNLSDTSRTSLAVIEENTRQIQMFIERLLDFARRADLNLAPWSAEAELEGLVQAWQVRARAAGIDLISDIRKMPPVLADSVLLKEALANLIANALEAASAGDRIMIRTELDGNRVKIEIEDTGAGISAENLDHVFTPFFTTKKGKGTGLGLALAKTVMESHGGELILNTRAGEGTRVTCWLPVAPASLGDGTVLGQGIQGRVEESPGS